MTQINPNAAPADTGTFSRTIRALRRLENLSERVKEAHIEQRRTLKELLVARTTRHRELFADLLPHYNSDFPEIPTRGWLDSWYIEDGQLTATFCSSFRGSTSADDVSFPVRYLEDGGEAAMAADAAQLRAKREEEERERAQERAAQERETLRQLMAKYPEEGAAAQGGSK